MIKKWQKKTKYELLKKERFIKLDKNKKKRKINLKIFFC